MASGALLAVYLPFVCQSHNATTNASARATAAATIIMNLDGGKITVAPIKSPLPGFRTNMILGQQSVHDRGLMDIHDLFAYLRTLTDYITAIKSLAATIADSQGITIWRKKFSHSTHSCSQRLSRSVSTGFGGSFSSLPSNPVNILTNRTGCRSFFILSRMILCNDTPSGMRLNHPCLRHQPHLCSCKKNHELVYCSL